MKHSPMPPWMPDYCLWCGEYVESRREEAGTPDSTMNTHPCWATTDGCFGCDLSPETNEDGCGSHATKQDAARWFLDPLRAAAPEMYVALKSLFDNCVMIHRHWGEGSNQKEADAAIRNAQAILAKIEGQSIHELK